MSEDNKPREVSADTVRGHEKGKCSDSGYIIFANDTSSGRPWCWGTPDLDWAILFARTLCGDTGQDVRICKLVGTVCVKPTPTEYVEARGETRPDVEGEKTL